MKKIKIIIYLLCLYLLFNNISYAGQYEWIQYLNSTNSTWIDWTNYKIYTESNATINEFVPDYIILKRKKLELMNILYNSILNLPILNKKKIKNILNQQSQYLLWDELNNSPYMLIIKLSEKTYRLQMGVRLLGRILGETIPLSYILKTNILKTQNAVLQGQASPDFVKGYSGVIIKINTNEFQPSLFIYIYSSSKDLIFYPNSINYDIFVKKGMALYLKEFNEKLVQGRVGKNPLVLQAKSIYNNNKHSLVLDEDSSFYLTFQKILDLIKKGKLAIIKKQYSVLKRDEIHEFKITD